MRIVRAALSVVLFSGWAYGVGLIVSTGMNHWRAFTGGAAFGMLLMAALYYAVERFTGRSDSQH